MYLHVMRSVRVADENHISSFTLSLCVFICVFVKKVQSGNASPREYVLSVGELDFMTSILCPETVYYYFSMCAVL